VIDPKGIESQTTFDDAGRTLKMIEHYVDGIVGDDNDKTTEYAYNAAGMTSLTARLTGGAFQTTEWVYGITQAGGHGIDSHDVVRATRWPDPTTGAASASQQDTVTLDALGRTWNSVDRNGTEHRLTYDPLGRVVLDTVKNWGSATDLTVDRIATAYDGQGNAFRVTSLAPVTAGGHVVNEVLKEFNGFGQMTVEYQSHDGTVDPNGTPKVQYGYDDAANTNSNHARMTTVTYPRGWQLEYLYEGFDNTISRLTALHDPKTSTRMEEYQYLGAGTVVRRAHPERGIDLSYIKLSSEAVGDAGDQYTGLDRFGRIVDQRWLTAANGVAVDRYQYTYDRNGNRLTESNALNTSLNETYGYDSLNQLTNFSTTGTTKSWDFDALGNWDGVTTNGTTQTRSHNRQNEITGVSGATTPTFDAAGNMTTDETGKQYVYDAWNRLVLVKNSSGTDLVRYEYDGLTRRIKERNFQSSTPKQNDLYYSAQWQVIEERPESGKATLTYVWSPVYVDAMVARDKDADGSGDGVAEERLYSLHDANFNVTAITQANGTVAERYTYDPFGTATPRDAAWTVTTPAYSWQYLHQGGRLNAESGLYSFRYREYSPTLGRWVTLAKSEETINTNQYIYCYYGEPPDENYPIGHPKNPNTLGPRGKNRPQNIPKNSKPAPSEENMPSRDNLNQQNGDILFHVATIKLCCANTNLDNLADSIYNDLKNFNHFNDNNIFTAKTYSNNGKNYAKFTLPFGGLSSARIGNTDQDSGEAFAHVELTFNDSIRTVTANTLGKHPIVGRRIWKVDITGCCVSITTKAVDRRNGPLTEFGQWAKGEKDTHAVWTKYIDNIAKFYESSSRQDCIRGNASSALTYYETGPYVRVQDLYTFLK
jgi:RHS repeat-associated protein